MLTCPPPHSDGEEDVEEEAGRAPPAENWTVRNIRHTSQPAA